MPSNMKMPGRAQAHHCIGGDPHCSEHIEQQAVGTLVLLPAMNKPVHLAEVANGALLECRSDIGQRSVGGQHGTDHAFARAPLHPGEVVQVTASVQVEGGDTLLSHQALGLGNARLVFVEADRLHALGHLRQAGQRLFRSFATYTHCHLVLPNYAAVGEI